MPLDGGNDAMRYFNVIVRTKNWKRQDVQDVSSVNCEMLRNESRNVMVHRNDTFDDYLSLSKVVITMVIRPGRSTPFIHFRL